MQSVELAGKAEAGSSGSSKAGAASQAGAASASAAHVGQTVKQRYKWFCGRCFDSVLGCSSCSEKRVVQDFEAWKAADLVLQVLPGQQAAELLPLCTEEGGGAES
jgi:hypothetical protein